MIAINVHSNTTDRSSPILRRYLIEFHPIDSTHPTSTEFFPNVCQKMDFSTEVFHLSKEGNKSSSVYSQIMCEDDQYEQKRFQQVKPSSEKENETDYDSDSSTMKKPSKRKNIRLSTDDPNKTKLSSIEMIFNPMIRQIRYVPVECTTMVRTMKTLMRMIFNRITTKISSLSFHSNQKQLWSDMSSLSLFLVEKNPVARNCLLVCLSD